MPSSPSRARAVIAHCWQGSPTVGWYPAAALTLAAQGFDVRVPALPAPDSPSRGAWLDALDQAAGPDDAPLVLIGHSLGALAVLHWTAERATTRSVAGLLVVAPPLAATGIPEVDRFLAPPPDLVAVTRHAAYATVLVSDADPYLRPDPAHVAAHLARHGFAVRVAPGRGHFSPASGLNDLPEIAAWSAALATLSHARLPA